MPSVEEMREALKVVKDPELMLDIINLGLVYEIKPDAATKTVDVDMTLTSPGCPAGPQILSGVHSTLMQRFPELDDVQVNLVWVPFWNPQMMSEEAKDELGIF
ncbi:MAG: metal-sulfur cluster assembly factor [Caldilineales bacterium]|nr:metal-sulfur cluster assembly factor [Caldilineales bacterium]